MTLIAGAKHTADANRDRGDIAEERLSYSYRWCRSRVCSVQAAVCGANRRDMLTGKGKQGLATRHSYASSHYDCDRGSQKPQQGPLVAADANRDSGRTG